VNGDEYYFFTINKSITVKKGLVLMTEGYWFSVGRNAFSKYYRIVHKLGDFPRAVDCFSDEVHAALEEQEVLIHHGWFDIGSEDVEQFINGVLCASKEMKASEYAIAPLHTAISNELFESDQGKVHPNSDIERWYKLLDSLGSEQ
jgi:hypothetical protein